MTSVVRQESQYMKNREQVLQDIYLATKKYSIKAYELYTMESLTDVTQKQRMKWLQKMYRLSGKALKTIEKEIW